MSIEVLSKTDTKLVFIVEGLSIEMINAIRRIILTEIPTMAIDEVIILKNDSPLYDEIVAHRLGMIPLTTDLENYNLPQECSCEGFGCPLCQTSLTCEITNDTNKPMVIYSGDLNSNDPNVKPVNPNIPIVKINKEEGMIFEAYAVLGLGKEHVKHQPVANVAYRYYPKLEFDDSKCKDCPDKCIVSRRCPKDLFDFSNGKKPTLVEDYWRTCTLCNSCQDTCPENAITVRGEEQKYIFSIESDGVHNFDTIINKAFEVFTEKIDEFVEKLEKLNKSEEI
ncbi:MAG: DNA-directed RNA polymerase subunit D [Promethearchaeia archaeon]